MSKKVQAIIVGAIVIVLLAGAIVALVLTKKSEPTNNVSSSSQAEVITLFEGDAGKLEYAKVKNKSDEYTIELLGENKWGIKALNGFTQVDTMYNDAIGSLTNIYANEIVEENCKDLAKFGLDAPTLVTEIKFKGKDSFKITLGDVSPDGYTRYAIKTGESTVYGISASTLSKLLQSKYDYLDKLIVPALETGKDGNPVAPALDYVKVARPNLEKPIILEKYKAGELTKNAVPGINVKITSPVNAMVNDNTAQTTIYSAFGLTAARVEMINPTAEDLIKYGFDKPTSVFEMTYNETSSLKITTGNSIEVKSENTESSTDKKTVTTEYYAMREGANMIYVLTKESITWLELEPKKIISSIAVLPPILDIDSVNIKVLGGSYLVKYLKGTDKTDTKDIKSSVNGKNVDVDASKKLLQLLYMTSIQDVNKIIPTKPADATVTYNYTDKKADVVDFYVLEDRQIVISLNGNYGYIGRAGYVDKVDKEIKNLVNGKNVDTDW